MVATLCNTFIADNLPHLINTFVIGQLVNFLDSASICQTLRACPRPDSSSSTTNQLSEPAAEVVGQHLSESGELSSEFR